MYKTTYVYSKLYHNVSKERKMISHLGEPARQTGPAHLHMNSLQIDYSVE